MEKGISKEEAKYQAAKGTIERNFGEVDKFNKTEAKVFFGMEKDSYERLGKEQEEAKIKKELEKFDKEEFKKTFQTIKEILKKYCVMREEYYTVISLWIIGTYIHDEFNTYPFLFINAMRGSGKSRLLKLISKLSKNGKLVADLREAVLFRTAKGSTICIDEFENVGSKDKGTLRELLNAAYKKGSVVERMKKVSGKDGEKHEVETFDLYTSIVMANIWGMDEVLEDRCISLIMEKSNDPIRTRLIEDFEENPQIQNVTTWFTREQCSLCSVVTLKNIQRGWNDYLLDTNYTIPHTTTTTHNYTNTLHTLFIKMDKTGIDGRNIELFYPLFVVANALGEEVLDEVIITSKEMVKVKKAEQLVESRDVMVIDFISKMNSVIEYRPVVDITRAFKEFVGNVEDDDRWINSKWVGKALKRLNLVLDKKRVARGVEVIPDVAKAQEKIKLFKIVENSPVSDSNVAQVGGGK